ncbi:uncharacterized protein LOC125674870 isoform X1 [Ostrea edulis]|uniref:uncharacterized protein LOC125674870 isoform X1 n=1 Tax=Ostrea edulis TaxID=37623 RepID=UPI002094FEF3|nr:uncharacterized protein LOC125674870 isoform X1 [Ostrea edulis]
MKNYIMFCEWSSMRRFTVAILVFSFCGTISTSPIFREPVSLDNNVMSCSRNMECGWLVCIWAQESNGGYGCQFFHNHCNCPSDLECSGTHMSEPTESHLVWDYRCQEPTTNRK